MWTRNCMRPSQPDAVRPWHLPVAHSERGRLTGSYPGYGRGLIRGGFIAIEPGLDRMGQLSPGFGTAMDPSDPSTWRKPVQFT